MQSQRSPTGLKHTARSRRCTRSAPTWFPGWRALWIGRWPRRWRLARSSRRATTSGYPARCALRSPTAEHGSPAKAACCQLLLTCCRHSHAGNGGSHTQYGGVLNPFVVTASCAGRWCMWHAHGRVYGLTFRCDGRSHQGWRHLICQVQAPVRPPPHMLLLRLNVGRSVVLDFCPINRIQCPLRACLQSHPCGM